MFVLFRMLSVEFICTAVTIDLDLLQILTGRTLMLIWYKFKVQALQLYKLDILVLHTLRL